MKARPIAFALAGLLALLLVDPLSFAQQAPSYNVVIVNPTAAAVVVMFSDDRAAWTKITFAPDSTNEVPYRKYVRIETKVPNKPDAFYADDISPAGKYVIIRDESGTYVLRKRMS